MFALTISKEKQEQIIKVANGMSEKQKRQFLASKAALLGYGGVSLISRVTGVSRSTIIHAMHELDNGNVFEQNSRQANKKMEQMGNPASDRDEQFQYINNKAEEFIDAGQPVISVDTKKKENIGNFKNQGTEYRKIKDPRYVLDHDFPIPELGKVVPYGIYVLNENTGFVNLGTDHDTAEFSVESILRWWNMIGKNTYPDATRIYITCDSGGSNSVNGRLWKQQLAEFSKITGLEVHISHFPAGASKWNKVEYRLFSYISKNWQGRPLIDIETVIELIGSTTTETGLKVTCIPDYNKYELGKRVCDKEYNSLPVRYLNNWGKRSM